MGTVLDEKLETLRQIINTMESVAVAFSGGIDSTYLLKVAYDCLRERVVALTAVSASLPAHELDEAQQLACQINARHVLIESHETEDPRYLANTSTRCYFCKSNVYEDLVKYAQEHGFAWVADGNNLDDVGDYRPGRQAAREYGVRSPLLEAGLTKDEIRTLARREGLPNWDKPAAACLSSRIPYGTMISLDLLSQVEMAERIVRNLGIRQVRVRHHDTIARIEVEPQDFETILAYHEQIVSEFQTLGFTYTALDLAGFRSGSLNIALTTHTGKTVI